MKGKGGKQQWRDRGASKGSGKSEQSATAGVKKRDADGKFSKSGSASSARIASLNTLAKIVGCLDTAELSAQSWP